MVYTIYTMDEAKVFMNGRSQAVRLPKKYRFDCDVVSIRREGDSVILEPIKATVWPRGFFKRIRISDPRFERPKQPATPAIEAIDD